MQPERPANTQAGTTGGHSRAPGHSAAAANAGSSLVPGLDSAAAPGPNDTVFVTGAYAATGDARIDRQLALEKALKQFGSPF